MPIQTDAYEALIAETVMVQGQDGDNIRAYYARPLGEGPHPSVLLVHHMPGWDEFYREMTLRFARHGYNAICPNLYERAGHGTPEEVAGRVRAEGGVADSQVVADSEGAIRFLRAQPTANGRVGVIGSCSGGRHAYLVATRSKEPVDAIVDLWGGGVVQKPEELTEKRPVAPIDYTKDLKAPLLGLFGNEDRSPAPDQVDLHEAALKEHKKDYEFHRYDGAGHGFFYYHAPAYRQEAAVDGWNKVWAFFEKHLT